MTTVMQIYLTILLILVFITSISGLLSAVFYASVDYYGKIEKIVSIIFITSFCTFIAFGLYMTLAYIWHLY